MINRGIRPYRRAWLALAMAWSLGFLSFSPARAFPPGDCNTNGIPDVEETAGDCDTNGIPDECDLAQGSAADCNTNGAPEICEQHPVEHTWGNAQISAFDVHYPAQTVISVPADRTITDVDVVVCITHRINDDIAIRLMFDGQSVLLSRHNGGDSNDYFDTRFDDDAGTSITEGTGPFPGSYRPQQPLSIFNGRSAAGDWTMQVSSMFGASPGTLRNWSLIIQTDMPDCKIPTAFTMPARPARSTTATPT
jgi:subtilisin-like proprotein convertase family protein